MYRNSNCRLVCGLNSLWNAVAVHVTFSSLSYIFLLLIWPLNSVKVIEMRLVCHLYHYLRLMFKCISMLCVCVCVCVCVCLCVCACVSVSVSFWFCHVPSFVIFWSMFYCTRMYIDTANCPLWWIKYCPMLCYAEVSWSTEVTMTWKLKYHTWID